MKLRLPGAAWTCLFLNIGSNQRKLSDGKCIELQRRLVRVLCLIAGIGWSMVSTNVAAVVVIDFATGDAGAGGTISYDGTNAVGSKILIGSMIVEGTKFDGTYAVDGVLNFDTGANRLEVFGSIAKLGIDKQTLLAGAFNSFSVDNYPGPTEVFTADGPDRKSTDLLKTLGVDPSTPFNYFGFSIESANGNVVSTDIVNTAVPVPAAAWLFGSGLLGMIGIARRRVA